MKRAGLTVAAALAALSLAGCAKNIDNKEAVQEGVRKGVAKRGIDVNQMDVNVTAVSFHGNTADATVAFAPKGTPASNGVTFNYQLEHVKDEWIIKGRSALDTMGHSGVGELPGKGGASGAPGNLASSPDGHLMPSNRGKQPLDSAYGTETNGSGGVPLPAGHPAVKSPSANPGSKTETRQ
ncbi:MAG: hypothetical protein M3Z09_09635 [Acidobacteriota bacterium]|nr:hypothetical protein [Acidobacteriota bacterium]